MKPTPNHHPSVSWIAGLFVLMAFLPFRSVEAQTTQAQTITLCVTPFGAVYLIQQPGLPDECRSDEHVEIALQVAVSGQTPQVAAAPPPGIGPPPGAGAQVVKTLNALNGDLTLAGTGGTTITDDGLGAIAINSNHADLPDVLPDQHHTPYADDDAVAAMGAKANTNALNHDRYADADATAAMGAAANGNPLNHNRYTDAEAITAVGTAGDGHSLDAADGDPTDALFVDNDGNVGIGTTSPATALDVVGTISASTGIESEGKLTLRKKTAFSSADLGFNDPGDPLNSKFQFVLDFKNDFNLWRRKPTGGFAQVMVWDIETGNVGIGTATPANRLTVDGNADISGTIRGATFGFGGMYSVRFDGACMAGNFFVSGNPCACPTGFTGQVAANFNTPDLGGRLIYYCSK